MRAADGQTAIVTLSELAPAFVLLDLHLPGASGEAVLAHIHGQSHLEKTVVILATADSLMADRLQGQCDFVLLKPVSFGQLRDLATRIRSTRL